MELFSQTYNPVVLGIGTANPPHRITQPEVQARARTHFGNLPPASLERLLRVYENTGIENRYWAYPLEWYTQERSFAERNAISVGTTLKLSSQAALKALEAADLTPERIGAVVFVTSTVISTPGIESYLCQQLGIPGSAIRLPIWGLGCAGGAAGLARAADLCRTGAADYVLLLAAEMCTLTFIPNDHTKSNVVASSLFADGVAAVVVGPGEGVEISDGFSRLMPESYDVMGWDVIPDGLQVRFARSIPDLVRGPLGELIRDGLKGAGISCPERLGAWVLHPGGPKVLSGYAEGLGVDPASVEASAHILRQYGNMSSPTVLYVLDHMIQTGQLRDPSVLLALGPGFAAEGVVLRHPQGCLA